LQQAGLKGLQLVKPNDEENEASFFLYTALGYYYQLKADSAQYYFYQSLYSAQKANATKLIAGACEALMSINFQMQQHGKVDSYKNYSSNHCRYFKRQSDSSGYLFCFRKLLPAEILL